MRLPNFESVQIDKTKLTEYLLSSTNEEGKAGFFTRFGFSVAKWEMLAEAMRHHAENHEVTQVIQNMHGTKFLIEGVLTTPDGRNPRVRSVWLV
jgi:hypothetical protein